jgi:hypothetical protein
MARKFKTSDIIDPVKAPITKRSLEHLNTAFDDLSEDIIKSKISSYTTGDIIILHGCDVAVTSGAIPGTGTATLSAGAAYYNGRVYKVDANAGLSTTNPQTLIWELVETTAVGDPATFSDGLTYDFHIIEKLRLVAGTAGAGLANYNGSKVKRLYKQISGGFSVAASTNLSSTSVSGKASVENGMVTYSLRVSGTTVADAGFNWTINVPSGYEAIQQDSGGIGLNPFLGFFRNTTDSTYEAYAQGSNDAMAITINSSNQIYVVFGGDLAQGAAKAVSLTFNLTCRAKY